MHLIVCVMCFSTAGGGLTDAALVVPPDVFLNLRYAEEKSSDPENRSPAESDADLVGERCNKIIFRSNNA